MIRIRIDHSDGDRSIVLGGMTMQEALDKIIDWTPKFKDELPLIKRTKRYKANPESVIESEKKSGWYIDLDKDGNEC